MGAILENVIFNELARRGYKIYSGRNGTKEIDFIAIKNQEIKYCKR